ncbi:hypothetical protein CDCA_CDCA06G1788 [Cyanidium caldarium]|uniref:Uncharacterized protein n=1 Tax=Cyanidium caldarium TaxID=2771 RepID=A0AAV9IUK1_CYACA|nr:hypothetical protein CDCA_CDCA06G1788 [Cyanidium caldarium]
MPIETVYRNARKAYLEARAQLNALDADVPAAPAFVSSTEPVPPALLQALQQVPATVAHLTQLCRQLHKAAASVPTAERTVWMSRAAQFAAQVAELETQWNAQQQSVRRWQRAWQERASLLHGAVASDKPPYGAANGDGSTVVVDLSGAPAWEHEVLTRSSMVTDQLLHTGQQVLSSLAQQRHWLKRIRTRMLDVSHQLGVGAGWIRRIQSRDRQDARLVRAMLLLCFSLVLLLWCWRRGWLGWMWSGKRGSTISDMAE